MSNTPLPIRIAQIIGISSSAALSGTIFSISYCAVPSFLLAPTPLLVRQWRLTFNRGFAIAPPIAAISSLSFSYLAYELYNAPLSTNHPRGELYALAALATISIVPYTLIFMKNVNSKLMNRAAGLEKVSVKDEVTEVGLPKGESAKQLLDWWATLNFGRGLLPMAGAVLALWASLG